MPFPIYKVKDPSESYRKIKDNIFDMSFKLALVGRSEIAGKSNCCINLCLLPQYYFGDFKGSHIYIVSPTRDYKWNMMIKTLNIPEENIFSEYDDDKMNTLLDFLKDDFLGQVENKKKPEHSLIIFDDVGFSNALRTTNGSALDRLVSNMRHYLVSCMFLVQKYSMLSTTIRENLTGLILFECSNKQLDLIYEDHGDMPKKEFVEMFREATKNKHDFLVINYSNPKEFKYDTNLKK